MKVAIWYEGAKVAEVVNRAGRAVCTERKVAKMIGLDGLYVYNPMLEREVNPGEGDAYIEALPYALNGTYISAVLED